MSDAITGAIGDTTGRMITRWVIVAEEINPDTGEPSINVLASEGLAVWDAIGLLEFGSRVQDFGLGEEE